MFLRNRAKQEQIKSASGGPPGAFATWQAAGEKHPSHQPGAWGSFLGVKAKPLRGRGKPRALTPIHSDSAPPSPCAGLWRVFRVKGGSRGWCGPQPPQGRGHGPLTRPERPKPAGRVSGALFPGTPALGERPRQAAGGACKACGAGGTPLPGFQGGAQPLGHSAANKKPLPKAGISCSSSFAFGFFKRPQKGPDLQIQKGERRKLDLARVCED